MPFQDKTNTNKLNMAAEESYTGLLNAASNPETLREALKNIPENKRAEALMEADDDGNFALLEAASNKETLKIALECIPVNERTEALTKADEEGSFALLVAASNKETIEIALESIPVNERAEAMTSFNEYDDSAMRETASNPEAFKVALMLIPEEKKADALMTADDEGWFVLMGVASNKETLKIALECIPVNKRTAAMTSFDMYNNSALRKAASNLDTFKIALELIPESEIVNALTKSDDGRDSIMHMVATNSVLFQKALEYIPEENKAKVVIMAGLNGDSVLHKAASKKDTLEIALKYIPEENRTDALMVNNNSKASAMNIAMRNPKAKEIVDKYWLRDEPKDAPDLVAGNKEIANHDTGVTSNLYQFHNTKSEAASSSSSQTGIVHHRKTAIADNAESFKKALNAFKDSIIEDYADALLNCEGSSRPIIWGGEPELLLIAKALKVNIEVYEQGKDEPRTFETAEAEKNIRIVYNGSNHYELYVNKTSSGSYTTSNGRTGGDCMFDACLRAKKVLDEKLELTKSNPPEQSEAIAIAELRKDVSSLFKKDKRCQENIIQLYISIIFSDEQNPQTMLEAAPMGNLRDKAKELRNIYQNLPDDEKDSVKSETNNQLLTHFFANHKFVADDINKIIEVSDEEAQKIISEKNREVSIDKIKTEEGHGKSALTFAVSKGYFEIAQGLIHIYQADTHKKDSSGKSAVDYAKEFFDQDPNTPKGKLFHLLCASATPKEQPAIASSSSTPKSPLMVQEKLLEDDETQNKNRALKAFPGLWEQNECNFIFCEGQFTSIKYSITADGANQSTHYCMQFPQSNVGGKGTIASVYFTITFQIHYKDKKLSPEAQEKAVKISSLEDMGYIWNEFKIRSWTSHLGIDALVSNSQMVCMIMDRMPGKDVFEQLDKIKAQDEKTKLRISYAILWALYIQAVSKEIAHYDIKPNNIMLKCFEKPDEPDVQENPADIIVNLIDFAFAASISSDKSNLRGSAGYIAPELFKKGSPKNCDAFSIARVLALFWIFEDNSYQMAKANVSVPLEIALMTLEHSAMTAQINLNNEIRRPGAKISENAEKVRIILHDMLEIDPAKRKTVSEGIEAFETIFPFLLEERSKYDPEMIKAPSISKNSSAFFNDQQQAASSSSSMYEHQSSEMHYFGN